MKLVHITFLLFALAATGCLFVGPRASTELHGYVQAGDLPAVQVKLRSGHSVNSTDGNGRSLLYVAALGGKAEMAEFLLDAGANPNQTASWKGNDTPLHAATLHGQWRVVEILVARNAKVDARNKMRETPLLYAARAGYLRTTQVLLAAGANPRAADSDGQSALHYQPEYARIQARRDRWAAELPNYKPGPERPDYKAVMEALIRAGAAVDATKKRLPRGFTPLMAACADAPIELVELLLENGADFRLETANKLTAYQIAEQRGRTNVMELLIRRGYRP